MHLQYNPNQQTLSISVQPVNKLTYKNTDLFKTLFDNNNQLSLIQNNPTNLHKLNNTDTHKNDKTNLHTHLDQKTTPIHLKKSQNKAGTRYS